MTDTYDSRLSILGSGEPVVLVSGMDGTGQLFYRQVPLLARSYRVATYALRDRASTMEQLVADLTRVVDTVSPADRRAIVVGESFGGALALSFALARPAQVSALVILNSFPYFAPQISLASRRARTARAAVGGNEARPTAHFVPATFAAHTSRRDPSVHGAHGGGEP